MGMSELIFARLHRFTHDLSFSTLSLRIIFTLACLYYGSYIYNFVRNCYLSRTTGFPSIFIPWDQDGLVWAVISVPLRAPMKQHLPKWLSDRLSLMIYNWEYLDRLRPFRQLEAQGKPSHTFQFVTCGRFELWTRDREITSEVLRRPDDFQVFDFTRVFMDKFGRNVLTVDNPAWRRHRKVVATVLNEKISAAVFQESIKQTDGMLNELFQKGSGKGDTATSIKVFDMMKKITIHVLSGAGMGSSPAWKSEDDQKPKPGFKMSYIDAVKVVIESVAGPLAIPDLIMKNWPSFLAGHAYMQKLSLAKQEFAMHLKDQLETTKAQPKNLQGKQANILTQLVAASEEGEGEHGSKNYALSQEEMSGNLFIFTTAGFDTTANTLSYALVYMARYPQWQEWIHKEIDELIPPGFEASTEWDYAEIFPKAKRVLAVMHETVRLQPPVVHEIKMVPRTTSITVSHGTYQIPAGSSFYVNNVATHLDPEVWRDLNQPGPDKNAPTAEPSPWKDVDGLDDETRFRPTRWIDPESDAFFQPPRGAFVPWSMGPRVCPGQKMAQVEFTTIFLRLFANCRIDAIALEVQGDGRMREEDRAEINERLDRHIRSSTALLALQMDGVYNPDESKGQGLKLKLTKRR